MELGEIVKLIEDVREDFQREEEQGLLQEDLKKAQHALAGKHACSRILRAVEARSGMRIVERVKSGRAR